MQKTTCGKHDQFSDEKHHTAVELNVSYTVHKVTISMSKGQASL